MVKINDIRKSFGGNKVLKGISIQGNAGQCIGIVGTNGSGKSTLLSIIAGIRKADSGTIEICGKDISKKPRYATEYIGYIPQENPVFPDLSVKDNLMLWYSDSKVTYEQAVSGGVIEMLGLTPILSQKVKTLSGGMRKRLSVAMAVANDPPVIILDEPSAALDLPTKLLIRDYLKSYVTRGGTVILATHDEEELSICNVLYVLVDGVLHNVPTTLRGDELLKAMDIRRN
jgi:ABC-2 type transport system ATP-binding protein